GLTPDLRRSGERPPAGQSRAGVPGVRAAARLVIVRWGLDQLEPLLGELGSERPLLVSSERWRDLALPVRSRFPGARPHAPVETVAAAIAAAEDADAVVALGSGSAIDTGKAVSAARRIPLVSVPTTYAGSEWTPYYGSRNETQRTKGG